MTYVTEKDASALPCPIARTFDQGKAAHCDGADCILWRWKSVAANHPKFQSALKREMGSMLAEAKAKDRNTKKTEGSFHKEAAARIADRPWDFMFMSEDDRGYCGLGGKPGV